MKYWHVFALLLILANVYASVQVYYPIAEVVPTGGSYPVGKMSPGHTLVIITDRGPKDDPWKEVEIDNNWPLKYTVYDDRMYVYITTPKDTTGTKEFCISFYGDYSGDKICPVVLFSPGTVKMTATNNIISGIAGETVKIPILLVSNSVGDTEIEVSCSFGEKYCPRKRIELRSGEFKNVDAEFFYPFPGDYDVEIRGIDIGSGEEMKEMVRISLSPSVKNDFVILHWGLPVYNPLLLPVLALASLVR